MAAWERDLPILARYDKSETPTSIVPLQGGGGFSGSRLWRLATLSGDRLLRRWPRGTSASHVKWIQAVLAFAAGRGLAKVLPLPIPAQDGSTVLDEHGEIWELTPWLPGRADFHARPSDERLRRAMELLSAWHVAVESFPGGREVGPSPGLQERWERFQWLDRGGIDHLASAIDARQGDELAQLARRCVDGFQRDRALFAREWPGIERETFTKQICLRDVWHDHLLFTGDELTGLVDFGALRIETVAIDLARLLGSLVGGDPARWQLGIEAYSRQRRLSPLERRALGAFDRANLLLSGLNWVEWLYVSGRRFDAPARVAARLRHFVARMEGARWSGPG